MPRVNNAHAKDTNGSNVNVATKVRKNAIKTEVESPGEQHVFHRKSERRRVARDIFLVFEEQPCRRVRGGANKKKTAQKPKFGHLMVEDPSRPAKGLLRDIKNEPKCYLSDECTTITAPTTATAKKVATKEKKNTPKVNSRIESKPIVVTENVPKVPEPTNEIKNDDPVARVNPIFLWVKQDDTRIVEVRCEDYDKRNRIRIKKTSNGWRSIPRTDPTTSKIVKILQTPLLKVKRELYENNLFQKCNENICANISRQNTTDVSEKQSFISDNIEDNVPACIKNAISETVISKEEVQVGNSAKVKHKNKKVKSKKNGKRGKKSAKLNIPKTEVHQDDIPEIINVNNFDNHLVSQNEECAAQIEQMIQSNTETIPNFNEVCVNNHNSIIENNSVVNKLDELPASHVDLKEPPVAAENDKESLSDVQVQADLNEKVIETVTETETYQHHTTHLQLCPITGLFLPTIICESDNEGETTDVATKGCDVNAFNTNFLPKDILVDLADCDEDDNNVETGEKLQALNSHYAINLDADTKNLKDLLDDADLMQHCSDNANSDADIIDSIVKRSCENNLIQETETLKQPDVATTYNTTQCEDMPQKDLLTDAIPLHIIDESVRDSPKCLSFNEAGEIEGLNGELFQSNNFMDTYEKDSSVEEVSLSDDGKKTESTEVMALSSPIGLKDKLCDDMILDEAPKDLSYKKREEVCPPSESRSQCAVTSSSDVVKSPQQGELPAIETTSEAIKNLILEQFIKLNAFNAIPTPVTKQQSEPMNLGKPHSDINIRNDCNDYATSTNYIETVVIDDNSDEEPMKKRVRNTAKLNKTNVIEETVQAVQTVAPTPTLIDKDPDPLTQLQLLIRNTQWKVPDPILVPKDRLRAVLASPAREIPLLITTRPELRLPEAFAYPEIIQNPNILVISMAQLEAILKNEMEMEKNKEQCAVPEPVHELPPENTKKLNTMPCTNTNKPLIEPKSVKVKEAPLNPPAPPAKCSHVETNLASDINAATLAVLNQMLWLPYFGQLSQEFLKTLKNPLGVQNKYASILPPLYNHHLGLQHLDEMYKNYLKQMTALKHISAAETPVNNAMSNFPLPLGAFQPTMETAVFQKMLQHQMANFLNINPMAQAADANAMQTPIQRGMVGKSPPHEVNANIEHMLGVEDKKTKNNTTTTTTTNTTPNISGLVAAVTEKSLRHNNNNATLSCDNAMTESVNYNKYAYMQKQEIDNKPRLTCKSLSNLLEPESVPSSPAVPVVNLTTDHIRNTAHELANNNSQINTINNKDTTVTVAPAPVEVMPFKSAKLNKVANASYNATHELAKQRKRVMNYTDAPVVATPAAAAAATTAALEAQTPSRNVVADNINVETNQALWHPLFGSNAKTGYSSPWQWTTVTATGE